MRKPGFSFPGPDCSSLLHSHIKSHRRVFMRGNLCRESPARSLLSTGFVLPQLHAAENLLSNLPHAKTAVQSPAAMRPLLPELGRGRVCIAPTLGMSQPRFFVAHRIPAVLHPPQGKAAPGCTPAHGTDSYQQLGETDKHLLDTETFLQLSFFLTFLVTNEGRQKQSSPPPHCQHPCAPRQEQLPQPLSATNYPSCFPSTQRRGKDHYPFQNESVEKIDNESKTVNVFPRAGGALGCQTHKKPSSGSGPWSMASSGQTARQYAGCYCWL